MRFFIYITGGLAYGQIDGSYIEGIVGGLTNTVSVNTTSLGWTFAGGEARIGNWTIKAEVLYIDFANISGATAGDDADTHQRPSGRDDRHHDDHRHRQHARHRQDLPRWFDYRFAPWKLDLAPAGT